MRREVWEQVGEFDAAYALCDTDWLCARPNGSEIAMLRHGGSEWINRRHADNWSNRLGSARMQQGDLRNRGAGAVCAAGRAGAAEMVLAGLRGALQRPAAPRVDPAGRASARGMGMRRARPGTDCSRTPDMACAPQWLEETGVRSDPALVMRGSPSRSLGADPEA